MLRNEFGYKGFVISDNHALTYLITSQHYAKNQTDAMTEAIRAGMNMELGETFYHMQKRAVDDKILTETEVRNNVKPMFYTRMRLGEFDPPSRNPYTKISDTSIIQNKQHQDLAIKAAMMSFVLLKNTNNALPILSKPKHIAVSKASLLIGINEQIIIMETKCNHEALTP